MNGRRKYGHLRWRWMRATPLCVHVAGRPWSFACVCVWHLILCVQFLHYCTAFNSMLGASDLIFFFVSVGFHCFARWWCWEGAWSVRPIQCWRLISILKNWESAADFDQIRTRALSVCVSDTISMTHAAWMACCIAAIWFDYKFVAG